MERYIFKTLSQWASDPDRKILILRGARQVGKTYAARQLSKSFDNFVEVNFEEHPEIHSFFHDALTPSIICKRLSNYLGVSITPGKTLLFFDEIQACPKALSSLRFFYEQMPELHVIACGSLLEFALEELPSQGVGRITSAFMYPMTFCEFLMAIGEEGLAQEMLEATPQSPLLETFHRRLNELMKHYLLIGGMPDVVKTYVKTGDIRKCHLILDDLIRTYREDFSKYKLKSPVALLNEVFLSIAQQAGGKFKYSKVNSEATSNTTKNALALLIQAGLAHQCFHTSAQGLPLGAQLNLKRFKVMLLDVGMQQRLLGLDLGPTLVADDFNLVNRGALAEVFVAQELIGNSHPRNPRDIYYWHREERSANAEVDFVIQWHNAPLPIEVKASTKGGMRSMHLFMAERNLQKGVRSSLENFSQLHNIDIIPLYAIGSFFGVKEP